MAKERSPKYPVFPLGEAIEKTKSFYEGCKKAPVDRESAVGAMGYGSLNGAALQSLSTIVQYGLLEKAGANHLKISGLGLAFALHQPQDREYKEALAEAVQLPPVFKVLVEKYPDGLPQDSAVKYFLMRMEQPFTDHAADRVISSYRESKRLAESLGVEYKEPEAKDGKMDSDHLNPSALTPPNPTGALPMPAMPANLGSFAREVSKLQEGEAFLQWPENLSEDSVADLEDWLALLVRKLKRQAKKTAMENLDDAKDDSE